MISNNDIRIIFIFKLLQIHGGFYCWQKFYDSSSCFPVRAWKSNTFKMCQFASGWRKKIDGHVMSCFSERPGYLGALTSPAWPLIESVVLAELRWTLLRPYKTCKPQWRGLLEPADPEDVKRAERHLGQRVGACVRRKGDKVENPWGTSKCKCIQAHH